MSLNIHALEQQIETRMKAGHIPGLAIAIVQDQEIIYAHGFGYTAIDANGERGTPVTPQTLFRIGSVSKALTGTAIMRMVEAGMLDLDTPVKRYIPWLILNLPGAEDAITLRMLLSHTSGLYHEDDLSGYRDPTGLEAYVRETISQMPLVAPPGKGFFYSGVGISLAAYIAEAVGKKNFTQLVQELVLDPLEMKRTTFDPTIAITYPMAQSHELSGDNIISVYHRYIENVGQYAETGANSTVLDLANFCMMVMNQGRFGEAQILSPASVVEMERYQADQYSLDNAGYGLTLFLRQYKGIRLVGHGGLMTTHFTGMVIAPDYNVAVIASGNRLSAQLQEDFIHGILDQILDLPADNPATGSVEPEKSYWGGYIGTYLGSWKGLASICVKADQLTLDWNGEEIPLRALGYDRYYGQKPGSEQLVTVGFIPEKSGEIQYIMLDTGLCKRLETIMTLEPNIGAWADYAGKYQNLLDIFTVYTEGDRFMISSREWSAKFPLVPLGRTRFASQIGLVDFQVDGDGVCHSLKLADYSVFNRLRME